MKGSLKAGILFVLLGIPALAFIFLKVFGKNNFDLPYFFPKVDEGGEASVVNGDTLFNQVPAFKLINQNGDSLGYKPANTTVVFTFFSRCGTICPMINHNIIQVAENFKEKSAVNFLGISVDPKHDSSAVLKQMQKSLGSEGLNINYLSGDKSYIYKLLIKDFKLSVADASEYNQEIKHIDEAFIHTSKVLLIDRKGYVRGIYDGTLKEDMDRLKVEIKVLESQVK